ncbi:Uncharacterised protein [Enterobacter hormaechei]|nr:Uncharacterised protein [Enterobacter hormaechei]
MGDRQHSGFCFPLLPLAQDGIHRLHAIFNRFRSRVEFVQQATGTQFGKRVDGNNGIAVGFQRVDEVAQKRSVVAKKPDNTRQLGFLFQQVEHVLMIRHQKITGYTGDCPEWRIFKIKVALIHND